MTGPARSIDWAEVRRRLAASQQALETGLDLGAERSRAVLAERSRLLARRSAAAAAPDALCAALVCRAGGEATALPVELVAEVVAMAPLARVPRPAPALLGLLALRAGTVRVFDLATLLGLKPGPCDHIVLLRGAARLGLAVDRAERLADIALDRLGPPTRLGRGSVGDLLLLDPDKLMAQLAETGPPT